MVREEFGGRGRFIAGFPAITAKYSFAGQGDIKWSPRKKKH
jgi:hypothetical protein